MKMIELTLTKTLQLVIGFLNFLFG